MQCRQNFNMNIDFFAGKKVLVMGIGTFGGGLDAAKFASNAGAKVTITDLAPPDQLTESIDQLKSYPDIEYHLGSHIPADFENNDIIIVNPAVEPDNQFLKIAAQHNKTITSQINIFFQLSNAAIIGITGANGKSTTAALTAHILIASSKNNNTQYENVWLSGNIGHKPLLAVLDQISNRDLVVLELSSFQLENLAEIKKAPKISVLTNLTPNHLDRHGTFENYCAAKGGVFTFQDLNADFPAVSIFNADDQISCEWFEKYKSDTGRICLKFSADDITDEIKEKFTLPGRINLSNLAAAITVAKHFGITEQQIKNSLPEFKALPHRLEFVAETDGVKWYNDSIATTPQSTIAALQAFDEPKILIAGGYDKGISLDELAKEIAKQTKAAILIGQTAEKIAEAIKSQSNTKIEIAGSLEDAVGLAGQNAVTGDIVLLSPACASYDMFKNFQQRGQEFITLINQISR